MSIPVIGVCTQLDRSVTGVLAKLGSCHLISRDGIRKGLAGRTIFIRTRQPKGTPPVSLHTKLMLTSLNNGKIFFVAGQWL